MPVAISDEDVKLVPGCPLRVISGRSASYQSNGRFRAYSGRSVAFFGSAISERLLFSKAVIQTALISRF